MASPFRLRSSRDSGTSDRDERVRTENIKAGRGNSTAERKSKPKAKPREEMSGKSDKPRSKKSTSPFKATPREAPRPMMRPPQLPEIAAPTPTPRPTPFPPDLAASPPRPDNFQQPPGAFRPPMEGPPAINPAMLQSVPPELRGPGPSMAGTETAPRPPLPGPLTQMPGVLPQPPSGFRQGPRPPMQGAPGQPPVGMGGPVGAGQPPVGMGGALGGNPAITMEQLQRMFGL